MWCVHFIQHDETSSLHLAKYEKNKNLECGSNELFCRQPPSRFPMHLTELYSAVQEQQDFHFIIKTKKKKNSQYKVYISLNASAFKGNVIAGTQHKISVFRLAFSDRRHHFYLYLQHLSSTTFKVKTFAWRHSSSALSKMYIYWSLSQSETCVRKQ